MLIGMCSLKGSPGVTTAAMALSSAWPIGLGRPVILECDPAGGTLAARFGRNLNPGLASLAAAARRTTNVSLVPVHAQVIGPGRVPAVLAPPSPGLVRDAVEALIHPGWLFDALAADPDRTTLVDFGRIDPRDAADLARLDGCTQVLLVARADVETSALLTASVETLSSRDTPVSLLVSGTSAGAADEFAALSELPLVGVLPYVPAPGRETLGDLLRRRRVHREFSREATRIAAELQFHADHSRTRRSLPSQDPPIIAGCEPRRLTTPDQGWQ